MVLHGRIRVQLPGRADQQERQAVVLPGTQTEKDDLTGYYAHFPPTPMNFIFFKTVDNPNSIWGSYLGYATQKCPCSHNNNPALKPQISLFDTALVKKWSISQNRDMT